MKAINYIKDIFEGIYRLFQGMYITLLNMLRKKVTEQYPENRGKHEYPERFRGMLRLIYDEQNEHKCTGCGICAINCPNGTLKVTVKKEVDEATGKEKRVLDDYFYDLGACIFCSRCVQTCPCEAIGWTNHFEHSVFNRNKLVKQLNK
jgi:NADH-quinone oxidoreductase subunit I